MRDEENGIGGEKKDGDGLMQPGTSEEDLAHATAADVHRSMPFSRRWSPCRRHRHRILSDLKIRGSRPRGGENREDVGEGAVEIEKM
jgi:hypothetical protein